MVAMVAVGLSYASALLLEHVAHLQIDIVIVSVVLALTLARTQRRADLRLVSFVVLPAAAVAADEVGWLLSSHPDLGDVVFAVCVGGSIWFRRFGAGATNAGTVAVLPFIAVLMLQAPVPPSYGGGHAFWAAVVALIACCWVLAVQAIAGRAGIGGPAWSRGRPEPATAAARPCGPGRSRLLASTRMALQMGVALAGAFAIGRGVFPSHWTWTVLTAFIVCSGARGRGDVGLKSVLRAAGAAVGTVVATGIAGVFGPHETISIVVIFAVLAAASWLRSASYAYWAGCVTAVLSLLYGYFGESAPALLRTRLAEIMIGALLGMAASSLVFPVRSADVARRRVADVLAALAGFLDAAWDERAVLKSRQARFERCVEQLDQIARSLQAHRMLLRRWRPGPHPADAVDAVRACVSPVRSIQRCASCHDDLKEQPEIASRTAALLAHIGAARRAIARQPAGPDRPPPAIEAAHLAAGGESREPGEPGDPGEVGEAGESRAGGESDSGGPPRACGQLDASRVEDRDDEDRDGEDRDGEDHDDLARSQVIAALIQLDAAVSRLPVAFGPAARVSNRRRSAPIRAGRMTRLQAPIIDDMAPRKWLR